MNPLPDLTGKIGRTTKMFLAWFDISKLTFTEKVYFPGKAGFPSKS